MKLPKGGKTVLDDRKIEARVGDLAKDISRTLKTRALLCVVVLRGGYFFGADLIRKLTGFERIEIDFVQLESYVGTRSTGTVRVRGHIPQVAGRDVLVIEDLLDTGRTLECLNEALTAAGATRIHYAVLVDKRADRQGPISPHFVGFTLPHDTYLFGYGMDFEGGYRSLPFVAALPRE